MNHLYVNDLIRWKNSDNEDDVHRVLWIDPDNIIAFTINIYGKQCIPQHQRINDILYAIEQDLAVRETLDPYASIINMSPTNEKYLSLREEAWKIISSIALDVNEPKIFYRNHRRKLIVAAAEQFNVSERVIYKYLTRYWQRGKVPNALLPDYDKSGGRGKGKTPGEKKLGRPRIYKPGRGINVDEETKCVFRVAIDRFYDKSRKSALADAYDMMLREYYPEAIRIENGIRKPIVADAGNIPSIDQFTYWHNKEQDIVDKLKNRRGNKKFNLENRAVTGKCDADLIGPGSIFQIDATVADVYLVSRYNRDWIIGRPVIYVVIDASTREVTGLYVGLEGPSWIGAMMALTNAFTDKVQYCKEYGI